MEKLKRVVSCITIPAKIVFCFFPISALLHFLFALSPGFAEVFLRTGGHAVRSVLAFVTNILPISFAEALLIFLPFVFVFVIIHTVRLKGEFKGSVRVISSLIAVSVLAYELFVITFAAGFYTKEIGEYFDLPHRDITFDELYEAACITADEVNAAYSEIDGKAPGSTSMRMTSYELNSKLMKAFESLTDKYGYPCKMTSRAKSIILSEPMTYTHISGVYTFFTGEANVNINYPDFVIPYTVAHELSHQRGVSRENEANFVAFLVCLEADEPYNPYIRYSGYLNMFQYMANAVASVSDEKYAELVERLDDGVRAELVAYSDFFDKYRDNIAADVSDTVNDAYLTVMSGTDSRSYGMVVDLATVYLLENAR